MSTGVLNSLHILSHSFFNGKITGHFCFFYTYNVIWYKIRIRRIQWIYCIQARFKLLTSFNIWFGLVEFHICWHCCDYFNFSLLWKYTHEGNLYHQTQSLLFDEILTYKGPNWFFLSFKPRIMEKLEWVTRSELTL